VLSAEEERPLRASFLALLDASASSSHRGVLSERDLAKMMSSTEKAAELFLALGCGDRSGMAYSDFVTAALADESAGRLSHATLRAAFDRFHCLGAGGASPAATMSFAAFRNCVQGRGRLSSLDGGLVGEKLCIVDYSSTSLTTTSVGSPSRGASWDSESEIEENSICVPSSRVKAQQLPTRNWRPI